MQLVAFRQAGIQYRAVFSDYFTRKGVVELMGDEFAEERSDAQNMNKIDFYKNEVVDELLLENSIACSSIRVLEALINHQRHSLGISIVASRIADIAFNVTKMMSWLE